MPPPPTPAESLATLLQSLSRAVMARTGWSLSLQLIALIVGRIQGIKQRLDRLAARIDAGTYRPRRAAPRQASTARTPRTPNKLPQHRGWLLRLLPETVGHRAQFETLLNDPEMVALMQAAPEAMARPLRSLCRMLGVTPPPALALPKRPRPARPPRQAPPPEPMPPQKLPEWLQGIRKPRRSPRICGPPRPA